MKQGETITLHRERYNELLQDNLLQTERIAALEAALQPFAEVACSVLPDPTGNPLQRLRVRVLPGGRWTARRLADALAAGDPPVMVRDYQTDLGYFDLDPCNLHPGEADTVARQLARVLRG